MNKWVKQLEGERKGTTPKASALTLEQIETQQLKKRIKHLEEERDILKKVTAQPTRQHMRDDVAEYMKYYNLERLHSANGDFSPIEYENSLRKVS